MNHSGIKRGIDLVGAGLGLVFTACLYLPLAVAIKIDSPGPVLFRQDRLGQNERIFRIYKFRTMYPDAQDHPSKPVLEDGRVTPFGRVLRRTSLDELPQFYNVLRGEMSLVGPRPEQVPFADCYAGWQRRRFEVKPGLTGWWQVNGRPQPMYEHVEYDIFYVDNRSLRLDLIILWRTLRAVWTGEGAV